MKGHKIMGLFFFLIDMFNPSVNRKGKALDGIVDVSMRGRGVTGDILGMILRRKINTRYRK